MSRTGRRGCDVDIRSRRARRASGTCARALVAAVSREAGAPELDLTLNAEEGMRAVLLDDADAWGTFFSDGSASGAKVTGPLE